MAQAMAHTSATRAMALAYHMVGILGSATAVSAMADMGMVDTGAGITLATAVVSAEDDD